MDAAPLGPTSHAHGSLADPPWPPALDSPLRRRPCLRRRAGLRAKRESSPGAALAPGRRERPIARGGAEHERRRSGPPRTPTGAERTRRGRVAARAWAPTPRSALSQRVAQAGAASLSTLAAPGASSRGSENAPRLLAGAEPARRERGRRRARAAPCGPLGARTGVGRTRRDPPGRPAARPARLHADARTQHAVSHWRRAGATRGLGPLYDNRHLVQWTGVAHRHQPNGREAPLTMLRRVSGAGSQT